MPPLNEGDLMFMPVTDPAISLPQAIEITKKQNAAIAAVPEVAVVVAKIAPRRDLDRPRAREHDRDGSCTSSPSPQWRPGMTREKLIAELDAAATLPGVANIWTQPIINRINMLTTGIRSEVGVKIFGSDLKVLEERARAVAEVLRSIPGAADVYPEQVTGAPYLDIRVNREAAARYGITVGAIQDVIETAVGETNLTLTIEGRQRFPVRVRYAPQYRAIPRRWRACSSPRRTARRCRWRSWRTSGRSRGPAMIASENGLLVVTVLLNVRGRDVGSFVEEARQVVAETVTLPPGLLHRVERPVRERGARPRSGSRSSSRWCSRHLLLLYLTYHSLLEAAHVLLAVPFALSGGIYLLYALGYNFSVAVWVGFIALFGTAVQTAVVMVIYLEEAVARKARGAGRAADAGGAPGGGDRGRAAAAAAQGDDGLHRRREPAADHVEPLDGRRSHEAAGHAGAGRHGQLAGHVLLVTPVIFYWLRERELRRDEARRRTEPSPEQPASNRKDHP